LALAYHCRLQAIPLLLRCRQVVGYQLVEPVLAAAVLVVGLC
jgi:hypothetical protein